MQSIREEITRRGALARIGTGALVAGAALAHPARLLAAPAYDPRAYISPELRPYLERFPAREVGHVYDVEWVRQMRGAPVPAGTPLPQGPWRAVEVPVPGGRPPVTIYVVNEQKGRNRGGIVHMHGGGYLFGQARNGLAGIAQMARDLDCTIVSVEYRLAPETTYLGSREDTYAGLKWLHTHAAEVGVDPAKIAVLGDSAGGGHAALLAITARDRGEVPVAFQCLVYPMLDDRTGSTVQRPRHMGEYVWTPEQNVFGWRSQLGRTPGQAGKADGVPGRVASVAGLPPAWIGVGGTDLFMEEDVDYGERLLNAGIAAEIMVLPGAFHAFDLIAPETQAAKAFTGSKMAALRRAIG